jgi:hypothetical protein
MDKKNVCQTLSQWKKTGMVACACHPRYIKKYKIGGSLLKLAWEKARVGGVAHWWSTFFIGGVPA